MSERGMTRARKGAPAAFTSTPGGLLQRKCACGNHSEAGAQCEECRQKQAGTLQRATILSPAPGEAPPVVHDGMKPRSGRDFSRVQPHANPSLSDLSALSIEERLRRCQELLKGLTTQREQEAILAILSTLPFDQIKKIVAAHGRRKFLRNFSFERRREAEAVTLTDADLKDPEVLDRLKSLRKPERYFKYLIHPAVHSHLEKLIRLREISTPVAAQDVDLSGSRDVKLNVNGIEVVVKPDRKGVPLWKLGFTTTELSAVATPNNGPPQVRAEIQTAYGERANPDDESGYGRGTTEEDKEAGTTSLRFHEGHHGLDALSFLQNRSLPQSNWRSGMTNAEYQQELIRYNTELQKYEKTMADYTELMTDCPENPRDARRCTALKRNPP